MRRSIHVTVREKARWAASRAPLPGLAVSHRVSEGDSHVQRVHGAPHVSHADVTRQSGNHGCVRQVMIMARQSIEKHFHINVYSGTVSSILCLCHHRYRFL